MNARALLFCVTAATYASLAMGAASIEIDVKNEIDLQDGSYLAKDTSAEHRYGLITHSHGRFEGGEIAQALCADGYLVSQLPPKFDRVKSVLKQTDFVLTKCEEVPTWQNGHSSILAGRGESAPISSDDVWYLLSNATGCTAVDRAAAELGASVPPSITPHQFAAILERASGMRSSVTYGGDDAPAMIFLRHPGNRGIADNWFTLVKGREACIDLGMRMTDTTANTTGVTTPAAAPSQASTTRRPSFDCTKARSASEKLICSDDELADLDVKLSRIFTTALKNSPDPAGLRRANTAAWKQRESQCADKKCLLNWYKQRLDALQ